MQLPTKQDAVATMSSLELVEIINSLRPAGSAELLHKKSDSQDRKSPRNNIG